MTTLAHAARRVISAIVGSMPTRLGEWLLHRAAISPPRLKSVAFERICSRISRTGIERSPLIETNLGLSATFRCAIPRHKSTYAFGRPTNSIAERPALRIVREIVRDCAHFLDVGANEGIYTFLVAAGARNDIRLHWFEPDLVLAARLEDNLRRNAIAASGNKAAVSAESGEAIFFRNLSDDASGSLTDFFQARHVLHSERVATVRLSDYLTGNNISRAMMKIDVEGAGEAAWSGLEAESARVKYLLMEMLVPEIAKQLPQRIIKKTGWHAYYLRNLDCVESIAGEFSYVEPFWNWFFCDLDPAGLSRRLSGTGLRVVAASVTKQGKHG